MNFEFFINHQGKWTWELVSFGGQPIAQSTLTYQDRESCIQSIKLIREDMVKTRIYDKADDRWI